MKFVSVINLLFFTSILGFSAPTNEVLLDKATNEEAAFIQSLEEIVKIESGSRDHEGLAEIASHAADRLKTLGAEVSLIPLNKEDEKDPRKVVHGVFRGKGKLRIMLIAHLDTVYDRGTLSEQPYQRKGDRIYGPGVTDDKGGAVMIMHTLSILKEQGWDNYDQITVLYNPDEEIGSRLSGPMITEYAAQHDVVLSYESGGQGSVRLGTSGIGAVTLEVKGVASHGSTKPEKAKNALLELAHLMAKTHDVADDIEGIQLNWTVANSGTVTNQIPDIATATADVRIVDNEAVEKLESAIKKRIEENRLVPGTEVAVTVQGSHRPMLNPHDDTKELANLAQKIFSELPPTKAEKEKGLTGRHLDIAGRAGGGTDAGFAQQAKGVAVLEGLGVLGGNIHSPNEFVLIESIIPRLYLNTRMLIELGKKFE